MSRAWGRERGHCLLPRPWAPSWCHSTTSFILTHSLQAWQSPGLTHSVKALHQVLENTLCPESTQGKGDPQAPRCPHPQELYVPDREPSFTAESGAISVPASPLIQGRQEAPHRGLPSIHTDQPPRLEGSVSESGSVILPPANPSSGSPLPCVLMTL